MKRCAICGEPKPLDEFMFNRKSTGKRDSYCRPCRAIYKREHYAANKQRYLKNSTTLRSKVAAERMAWILRYLETHPCVDCGETDPVVLEFDHLGDKDFNVSSGVVGKAWAEVLAEVEKCEIRCANCHRRRTAQRRGFARVMFVKWRIVQADRVT